MQQNKRNPSAADINAGETGDAIAERKPKTHLVHAENPEVSEGNPAGHWRDEENAPQGGSEFHPDDDDHGEGQEYRNRRH